MILSVKWFCQTLTALTIVQASHCSPATKDQNSLKSRLIHPRGLNTTTAENKNTVANSITTSNRSSVPIDPVQYVRLGLPKNTNVQDCAITNSTPVVQDCSCSTKQVAAHAIDDAITMAQAVYRVWNDEANLSILRQFMGGERYPSESCQTEKVAQLINREFSKQRWMCTLNEGQQYWHT